MLKFGIKKLFFIFTLTLINNAYSEYKLTPIKGSSVEVTVPYTFGKYKISSVEIQGSVVLNKEQNLVTLGELIVPVKSLQHDKSELVCHLQESLTLDYARSDFPDTHVCKDDALPQEGKNAPVCLNIVAILKEPIKLGSVTVPIHWSIHGETKELLINVHSVWDAEKSNLIISGETKF